MIKTKVVACDIYGTVLCENDPENIMPPRRGFVEFVRQVKGYDIQLVSTSDANNTNLLLDIEATFKDRVPFGPEIFDKHYHLTMIPKSYSDLLVDFAINPEELLVIGNDYRNDLSGAPILASKILVPTYKGASGEFNFSTLRLP